MSHHPSSAGFEAGGGTDSGKANVEGGDLDGGGCGSEGLRGMGEGFSLFSSLASFPPLPAGGGVSRVAIGFASPLCNHPSAMSSMISA
jgi:hypothetical protein